MTLHAIESYRQYRAPREPDSRLIAPSLPEIDHLLDQPDFLLGSSGLEFCGQSWELVRDEARREAVALATAYTAQYASPRQCCDMRRPIILSGHQPELFHAGVWFKNFLLNRFANEHQAITINFLVDNDLCRETAIRVPGVDRSGTMVARNVPFDDWRAAVPWEMRSLESRSTWEAFPANVQQQLQSLTSFQPLLMDLWPHATEALRRHGRVGSALAEGRHRMEIQEGLQNLEVPLSQLVSTMAFARFSVQLLSELPRFQDIYNSQRETYRQAHHIRSAAHPVPKLEQDSGWIEGPWWVYRQEAPIRKRLWIRMVDDQLLLSDRSGWQEVIEGRLDCENAAMQWLDLQADDVCLRPRALLTTMYLRMFVGDLFVHGIGGGKYDQLTDGILRQFFEIEPPPMAVATATLQLPLGHSALEDSHSIQRQIQALRKQQWDYRYHANTYADQLPSEATQLSREKEQLLEHIPPRGQKWEWHQRMSRINQRLSELASERSHETREQLNELNAQFRQAQLLESREYSFCLYPRERIVSTLKRLTE